MVYSPEESWPFFVLAEAVDELGRLPATERVAILNAVEKLKALGPKLGYPHSSAVRDADRLRELRPRSGRSQWRAFYRQHAGCTGGRRMKLSHQQTFDEVLEQHRQDPEFRQEWDRLAFAREVAIRIVRYRTAQGLTQSQLAKAVGMRQPGIARLESGDQAPSLATLARITAGTGISFHLEVSDGTIALSA